MRRFQRLIEISAAAMFLLMIGLAITAVTLKVTWDSWRTVRGRHH